MFLCVWGSLAHPRESVPNPANVEKCVNERGRAGLLACVCVCQISICAGTHALQRVFFYLCILVFVSVCVHLRPLIQHHQDTGLNEGSYSPFSTLLSQQVAHNVLFSLRKLLVFLLFLCSYLFLSLPLSPPLTLFLTLCAPSHKILVRLASSLETLSHFFSSSL